MKGFLQTYLKMRTKKGFNAISAQADTNQNLIEHFDITESSTLTDILK